MVAKVNMDLGGIKFNKVTMDQIDLLREISLTTFRHNFYHLNTPENYELYVSRAFSIETLLQELKQSTSEFYFGYVDHEITCYFKLNLCINSHEQYAPWSAELQRIYIVPAFLALGIGTKIIDFVKYQSRSLGFQVLWLGVWEHNPKAIQFYERHGFKHIGEHKFMLGLEEQTDLLMVCEL